MAKKVLIAYYSFGETPKVADKLKQLFLSKGFSVVERNIRLSKDIEPKKQFKKEKELVLREPVRSVSAFDLVVIGTPMVSFSSVPAVNVFIRSLPEMEKKNFVLFATGIGLPGKAVKKMQSLLSMKGGTVLDSHTFSSIFEFDQKKLLEAEKFFERFIGKV